MSRLVLMLDGVAHLLLSSVVRDDEGNITCADVVNGGWQLRIKDKVAYSYQYGWVEVEVPNSLKGDYNDVMLWAETIRTEESTIK